MEMQICRFCRDGKSFREMLGKADSALLEYVA